MIHCHCSRQVLAVYIIFSSLILAVVTSVERYFLGTITKINYCSEGRLLSNKPQSKNLTETFSSFEIRSTSGFAFIKLSDVS